MSIGKWIALVIITAVVGASVFMVLRESGVIGQTDDNVRFWLWSGETVRGAKGEWMPINK